MAKHFNLQIPEPCHENWGQMTPMEKGRFCGSCQKQVVDFTKMSDGELRSFFLKARHQSVCGRLDQQQMNRNILVPGKTIPWVKYFFQVALPAFLFTAKAAAQGQVKATIHTVQTDKQRADSNLVKSKKDMLGKIAFEDKLEVKGKVMDPEGNPLVSAVVIIKGTNRGVVTDEKGQFSIDLKNQRTKIVLVVSCVGSETLEVAFDPMTQGPSELIISLSPANALMGEVVITGLIAPSWKSEPIALIPAEADSTKRLFTVYPNPVMSGNNLHIQWKGKEEGYYQLNLVNQSGKIVHQREIWIDAEARVLNFDMPKIAAGTYILSFANKKTGFIITEKIIVR